MPSKTALHEYEDIRRRVAQADDVELETERLDLTPVRPSRRHEDAPPALSDVVRHRPLRDVPHADLYRVGGGRSPTTQRQVVYKDALPRVRLSFEDFESSLYFKSDTVHNTEVFSPVFAAIYDREMANLQTPYLGASRTGYKGPRNLPVVFNREGPHCVPERTARAVEATLSESDPETVLTELLRAPPDSTSRAVESAAMTRMLPDPPRTERSLRLFHWVTHSPGTWTRAVPGEVYSCTQWLDTHSHPAWFWPRASATRNRYVLLRISVPQGTPALRAQRYNSHTTRIDYLREGQWTYTHTNANDEEIRLPPGEYRVSAESRREIFAGHNVLLVYLHYSRRAVGVCGHD